MATFAPRSASARAIARPMRLAAPVTSTVFPCSSLSISVNREALLLWRGVWSVGWRLGSCRGRWCGLGGGLGRPYWLLNAGLSCGGLALIVLIGRKLLLRVNHGDGDRTAWFGHLIFFRVGGEAGGDNLHANSASGRDNVDRGLAIGVGLDLQIALVLAV